MTRFACESEMRQPVVDWLSELGFLAAVEFHIWHMADIVAGKFGPRPSPGRVPPLMECISVELKLNNIAGVIDQAKDNRSQTTWAYCAMPTEACKKMIPKSFDKFRSAGVGLVSVGDVVREIIKPKPGRRPAPHLEKNLWRRVRKLYLQG